MTPHPVGLILRSLAGTIRRPAAPPGLAELDELTITRSSISMACDSEMIRGS